MECLTYRIMEKEIGTMDKTCNSGSPCRYKYQDTGSIGYGCNYQGYCDYQLPRDSRMQPITYNGLPIRVNEGTDQNG